MEEYVLFTDCTADLPAELAREWGIEMLPMEVKIGQDEYLHYADAREIGFAEFYKRLRAGEMATTSQITPAAFRKYFTPFLQEDRDILYIAFSSGLSGTYGAAVLAAEELMKEFPGRKIRCVDSLAASVGEGLLVYTAAQKKREGMSLAELAAWTEESRSHLCHWFTVDDLHFLKRGGRVSAVSATFGSMLKIKPVLHVDDEGHLIPMKKAHGRKKALKELVEMMRETVEAPEGQTIFIGHGDCAEDAELVARLVRAEFPVKEVRTMYIGPVIGSHSGPGTVALFFFGSHK